MLGELIGVQTSRHLELGPFVVDPGVSRVGRLLVVVAGHDVMSHDGQRESQLELRVVGETEFARGALRVLALPGFVDPVHDLLDIVPVGPGQHVGERRTELVPAAAVPGPAGADGRIRDLLGHLLVGIGEVMMPGWVIFEVRP
ncbi:hypothetical protein [Streptomyces sp. NPDC003832]